MVGGVEQDLGARAELVGAEVHGERGARGIRLAYHLGMAQLLLGQEAQPVARIVACQIGLDRLGRPRPFRQLAQRLGELPLRPLDPARFFTAPESPRTQAFIDTAHQSARALMGILDDENIGDSYGQIREFDGLWSINQSREEKQMNVARMFNIKLRDGKSSVSFPVFIDPLTLDFSQISDEEFKERMSRFKEAKAHNTIIDGKPWKPNPVKE